MLDRDVAELVGRESELARLGTLLAGHRPVSVVGEAGIGKTTLVRAAAARTGLRLLEGGALATLAWTPLLALRRAVGDGFKGDLTAVATEVERRVGPDLLFIDDLQWADDDTRDIVALLAGRVALVATIRLGDTGSAAALELIRSMQGEVVELTGLGDEPSSLIVRRTHPSMDPSMVERLVAQAGGNPLLLEELATRGRPTPSLSRALGNRLDDLTPGARRSFALLALAGRPLPPKDLGPGAAELRRTGIAIEADGRLAVRHALFAETAVSALSFAERQRLHARLAELMTEPGERARHLAEAGEAEEAAKAAQIAADAAGRPIERASHLELVAQVTPGAAGNGARLEAARILVLHGGSGPARAMALLEAIGDGPDELLVERDALLGRAAWETGDLDAARTAYLRGRVRSVSPRSMALARLDAEEASFLVNVDGDYPTAARILAEAIAAGRTTPRTMAMDAAMRSYRDAADTLDQALAAYEAAWEDDADPFVAFRNARNVAFVATEHRGHDPALAFVDAAAERFAARDMAGRADALRAEAVQLLLYAGRYDEVVRRSDELLEQALGLRGRQLVTTSRAVALASQGHADDARDALDGIEDSVTDDWDGRGELLAARIETEVLGGRPTEALAAYASIRSIRCPSPANGLMSDVVVRWALVELGRDPGAAITPQPWPVVRGAAPETEGLRALVDDDPLTAADRFGVAADRWAGFHRPRELVCRWARGEALRRAGSGEAEAVLRHALQLAEAAGFEVVAARSRRSLRQTGVYLRRERTDRRSERSARLTSRERETLELVGRGLATPEIARRMGLGRGTVDQILGAAMRKLGAVSRVQAAAILQRGPDAPSRPPARTVTVRDEEDAQAAVLAALEGALVAVDPAADPALADRVHDDLRRLGRDDLVVSDVPAGPPLGTDAQQLLARIAEGMSLGEAANSLHISRRTADRRLRAARRALGVATTAEALVAFQRRGSRTTD